jgi:hypothetical protein
VEVEYGESAFFGREGERMERLWIWVAGQLHGLTVLRTLSDVIWIIGLGTTIYGMFDLWGKWRSARERRREENRKLEMLRNTDHFIAHLIHIGGEGTSFNTLKVRGEEEGGYYFTPAQDFVLISETRGGDVTVICASELAEREGYEIDSIAIEYDKYRASSDKRVCYLVHRTMKDEIWVRFVKKGSAAAAVRDREEAVVEFVELSWVASREV